MRAAFVASEVKIGLFRNLGMSIAVMLTVAVSLGLFGGGLLMVSQVNTMKDFWYDRVEVSVFLCNKTSDTASCKGGTVTPAQRDQIRADLVALKPLVEEIYYESSQEAFQRFKDRYKNSPILNTVTADALPESFRIKLSDPTKFAVIASAFQGRPGVDQVQDERALLQSLFDVLGGAKTLAFVVAGVMLLVTLLLVANAMQLAAASRKRETGVMRLVGASNFYIQLPFLLEAAIAAAVGCVLASVSLIVFKHFVIDNQLTNTFKFTPFIGWDSVWLVIPVLFVVGIGLSVISAFFTLLRYLKV